MIPKYPDVSIVLCTYTLERWDDLLDAVNSLRHQTLRSFEIIVVVDHNPILYEKAKTEITDARVIENDGSIGLSSARNSGISVARGNLIAFLDDDAMAESDWLAKLSSPCREPSVLGVGGKVEPLWLTDRPSWFPDEFGWVLGYSYTGLPKETAEVRNFFGTGMCWRREVFETAGGFRNNIGRIDKIPLGCEETELCIRASQSMRGGRFIFEPSAIIQHKIPYARASWAYFRARCYSEGLSKAAISKFVGAKDALSSERAYTYRILPKGVANGIAEAFLKRNWSGFMRAWAILIGLVWTVAGYIKGSMQNINNPAHDIVSHMRSEST